eukprot:s531_g6.t2
MQIDFKASMQLPRILQPREQAAASTHHILSIKRGGNQCGSLLFDKSRGPAQVDSGEAARMRAEIDSRVRAEACQPWKDFLAGLARGATRSALAAELAEAAQAGNAPGVLEALDKGALLDVPNEYGETATFLAALAGSSEVIQVLLSRRADHTIRDNAGLSACRAAQLGGSREAMTALAAVGAQVSPEMSGYGSPTRMPVACRCEEVQVTRVIPLGVGHAGAGTTVVDNFFEESFLARLDELWKRLPLAPKQKASPTDRAYYHDVEGWLTGALNEAVRAAQLADAAAAMPHMRFLIYPEPGGASTEGKLRSTYTFLLYLSDCRSGGETTFLECLEGDETLASSGGLAPGERAEVAAVSPARGRLLLMPHACPHLAAPVDEVPKVLVRGEVLPPDPASGIDISRTAAEPAMATTHAEQQPIHPGVRSCWDFGDKSIVPAMLCGTPGIPKPRVRNWMLQARQLLSGSRPMSVGKAVLMWSKSFALFFKGDERRFPERHVQPASTSSTTSVSTSGSGPRIRRPAHCATSRFEEAAEQAPSSRARALKRQSTLRTPKGSAWNALLPGPPKLQKPAAPIAPQKPATATTSITSLNRRLQSGAWVATNGFGFAAALVAIEAAMLRPGWSVQAQQQLIGDQASKLDAYAQSRRLQTYVSQTDYDTAVAQLKSDDYSLGGAMDSAWLCLCGALVMFMHAGFAMLETGSCRAKNASNAGNTGQSGKDAAEPGGARDRSRSPAKGPDEWHETVECGGVGSCFFNAVATHYAMSRDNFSLADAKKLAKARGATLRAEVAGYIREKADAFKPFWLPPPTPEDEASRVNLVQIEGGQPPDTWEAYLKALDRPTRWANDISFRATVKRLNCRIIVAVDDIKNPTQLLAYRKPIDFKDNRKQVVILLLYREKHYQLIMAKPGKEIPESWRALPVGGHTTVPRGGGGDTWLPPRSASSACSDVEDTGGSRLSRGRTLAISFAECRTSPSEQASATQRLQRMGCHTLWVPATSERVVRGRTFWKGGLCVATACHVPSKPLHTCTGESGDLAMIDFDRFRVVSVWRRPGVDREDFDTEVAHIFGEAERAHAPCIAVAIGTTLLRSRLYPSWA